MKLCVKSFVRHTPAALRGLLGLFMATAFLLLSGGGAFCAMHEQMAISTRAIALGNTVTADPPGVMSIHYNPAGLTRLRGKTLDVSFHFADVSMSARFYEPPNYIDFFGTGPDPVAGSSTSTIGSAINIPFSGPASVSHLGAPTAGFSWNPPGSRWTVGLALYAPFAVGFEYPSGPAVYDAQYLYQQRLVLAPAIGFKITDHLSIGASVGIGNAAMGIRQEMRAPNDLVALSQVLGELTMNLSDIITLGLIPFPLFGGGLRTYESFARMTADNLQDNLTTSYNLGLLWEPTDWFAAGITYQSETKAKFGGNYMIEYHKPWRNMMDWLVSNQIIAIFTEALGLPTEGGVEFERGRATLEMELPRRFQAGIKIQPIKQAKFLFDIHWVQWSAMAQNVFKFDQGIQILKVARLLAYQHPSNTLVLDRHTKDTAHWSAGLELMPLHWLTLRLGYEMRPSSVKEEFRDLMFALPDINAYSGGLGFKLTRNTNLDLAFAYLKGDKISSRQEDKTTSKLLNHRDLTTIIYNPYAGLNVDSEMEAYIFSAGLSYFF
ncbi:MAG: outer membrane protein transport protein [Desulfatibacillaceae bacterium]|nr:outer membrane protein transport protein [Desulfatibacillaceae bacterium]